MTCLVGGFEAVAALVELVNLSISAYTASCKKPGHMPAHFCVWQGCGERQTTLGAAESC